MDRDTQIEINNMANALEGMAIEHFANDRSRSTPFETSVSFYEENPERARLKSEDLRSSLCEAFSPSRVHVSIQDTNYVIRIDRI